MFVSSNSFKAIRKYYSESLGGQFSSNELKLMLKQLFLKRFGGDSSEFILADDRLLTESDLLYFHKALKRIANEEPFQYIIGEVDFYGVQLLCDSRALIPRPETEELVDWMLSNATDGQTVVDLCSGSGCIALALKSQLPNSKVYAVEYSDDALDLIDDNLGHTKLDVNVLRFDVLKANYASQISEKASIIVSNPPYIPFKERDSMAKNVLEHEPEMALFVEDKDPLIFYRKILEKAPDILEENGWVYFEIHEDLSEAIVTLFKEFDFVNIEVRKDLQGKERMVRGMC